MKMIERIARQTVNEFWAEEIDDEFVTMINVIVERIDAERGKDAVAYLGICADGGHICLQRDTKGMKVNSIRPLFLSPTTPEGMALAPIEPTDAMIVAGINTPLTDTGDDTSDQPADYRAVWKSMIAAAQGERK